MEKADRELILALCPMNLELRQLYDEHIKLEKEVRKIEHYVAYSATAQLKQTHLKKEKLKGVDAMMTILGEHRRAQNVMDSMH